MVLRSCTYIIPVNCRKINSSELISWNNCVFGNNVIICVITMASKKSDFTPGGHDEANIGAIFDDIMAGTGLTGEDMADVPEKCRDCPVLKYNLGGIACMRQEVQEGLNVDRLTSHCAWPLKMRGSRDGKTVTVTSCMSGIIAHSGETSSH